MSKKVAVRILESNCKQCGICSALCPKEVFSQRTGEAPQIVNPGACIGCRLCQLRCPDLAIEVEVQENE